MSYSDAADTNSVKPILLSARARSSRVTTTERGVAEVVDEVAIALCRVDSECRWLRLLL